jgi:anti-sigma factor RsiW
MTCRECQALIPAWVDQELSQRDQEAFELHLRSCEACASLALKEQSFVVGLREQLPRESMPSQLRARILHRVAEAEESGPSFHAWRRGLVALLGLAIMLMPLMVWMSRREQARDWTQFYMDELGSHPTQASAVQHASASSAELASWFQATLHQSLHIPEMPDATLLGGRIAKLGGKPIGLAVYASQGSTMSLFMGDEATLCPQGLGKAEGELFSQAQGGESLVAWKHNGHFHVAVSPLSLPALQALARECQHSPMAQRKTS